MKRILFVCLGNICRSPMAEFYFKDYIKMHGAAERYEVASAGTSGEEAGNPVYPPARRKLAENGIDAAGKRARRLTAADGAYYDVILAMDMHNVRDARRIVGEENARKVVRLLELAGEARDVADPWYTGDFDATMRDVEKGCKALFALQEGKK